MGLLKKCEKCEVYTFEAVCPKCKETTKTPHPMKFSPGDKYWKERLIAKGEIKC